MARRRFPLPLAISLLGLLAGCATPQIPPDVDTSGMPSTEVALQRSLDRTDTAMGKLGQFGPGTYLRPVMVAELERPVSLAWSGPIDQGVKALADRIGYRFYSTGPHSGVPIAVGVNLTNVPILDLFRAMGDAAGTSATVVVDPDHHQVEVQHHV
ncbi:MAG: DotD/TraH family lipoprotein [Janthinobacterium lividum]